MIVPVKSNEELPKQSNEDALLQSQDLSNPTQQNISRNPSIQIPSIPQV